MSYKTVSSKRRDGDEWVQVQCDGCGALGPRVEGTLPARGFLPREILALARLVAGTVERTRPGKTKSGRSAKWSTVDDLCRDCAYKARVVKLIADLGGPINVSHLAADGTYPDSTNSETT